MVRIAVTDDPFPVALIHGGKLLEGFQPLPVQLRCPALEELACPGRVIIVPELTERFFQQIGLVKPLIGLPAEKRL